MQNLSRMDFLSSAGLYVTPDRLFFVRLRKSLLRVSLVDAQTIELPSTNGPEARSRAVTEALRALAPGLRSGKDAVHVCLSAEQTVGVEMALPAAARENLSQVVAYEAERHLPFRRDEVYYDYLPANDGEESDKIKVLLFAAPKKRLDEIIAGFAALGVRAAGVEPTATSVANYLFYCAAGLSEPSVVIGSQTRAWEIVGLRNRKAAWGDRPEMLFADCLPRTDWIRGPGQEIFFDRLKSAQKFFAWGSLGDFLLAIKEDGLAVDDLSALADGRLRHQGLAHPFFVPAIGAALRGLREDLLGLNLLPSRDADRPGRLFSRLNVFLLAILLLGSVAWGLLYPIKDELRLRQIEQEIAKLSSSLQALQAQEEELARLKTEVEFIAEAKKQQGRILAILDELSRVVPQNAYLSQLRYRDGALEIQGNAESASNLVPLLERSPLFEKVGFNAPSTRARDNRETFSLKAQVERPAEKGGPP